MDTINHPTSTTTTTTTRRPTAVTAIAGTFVIGLGMQLLTAGPNPLTGENRRLEDVIATVVIIGLGAIVVFGVLMPLARRGAGRAGPMAAVTGLVALASLPVLVWSAGSLIIAVGAVFLGREGLAEAAANQRPAGLARTGFALGAVVALITIAFLVFLSIVDFNPGLPA